MSIKSSVLSKEDTKHSRRTFFIGAGAIAGSVVAVSQTPIGKAVIQEIGSTVSGKNDGYQLSAHVRKYYETTLV